MIVTNDKNLTSRILTLEVTLQTSIQGLREDIQRVEQDSQRRDERLRTELRQSIDRTRGDLKSDISQLSSNVDELRKEVRTIHHTTARLDTRVSVLEHHLELPISSGRSDNGPS